MILTEKTIVQSYYIQLFKFKLFCKIFLLSILFISSTYTVTTGQQITDINFIPKIEHPIYVQKNGPIVFIDEGHNNFHTMEGRYSPFSKVLSNDGYIIKAYDTKFTEDKLKQCKILVISNALNAANKDAWYNPTLSAFDSHEIEILKKWVEDGGSLFLIADHMPMAGAAYDLAKEFGFVFTNGFALNKQGSGHSVFTYKNHSLHDCLVTKGRNMNEKINRVISYTGQAFTIPNDAIPILTFDEHHTNYLPDTAFVFNEKTIQYNSKGLCQGAYKYFGKGKIVVFGEAAMFTAQLIGPKSEKCGINNSEAKENLQLLLNIVHWLDGLII